jgi:hypothetical protein
MASQSDGDDMWVFDAPVDDYATSRPQIQALNVETPEERFPKYTTREPSEQVELKLMRLTGLKTTGLPRPRHGGAI